MKKKHVKTFSAIALVAGAILSLQACEKKSADMPADSTGNPASASLSILPEKPAAGTMLRAVATGASAPVLRWERNGEALGDASETLDTSAFKKGDRIRLIAAQGGADIAAETVLLNSLPEIKSMTFRPGAFSRGQDIEAVVGAWDADNDSVQYEYQWFVNGQAVYSETGPSLSGNSYSRGDEISVRVIPYDGEKQGAPFEAKAGAAGNAPPRFASNPPAEFSGVFVYKPKVTDPDEDTVSISIVKGPEGLAAEKGSIEWNAKGQKGAFEVIIAANDGNGGESLQTFELKVGE